jgi:aryl sulfotransferase
VIETRAELPVKTREIVSRVVDSTRWNDFKFRDDDIVVASFGKSGSTWTQEIVGQLIVWGSEDKKIFAPWIDMRPMPFAPMLEMLEAQGHRRSLKTHLPVYALTFSPKAKYIYVARDPRDIIWSVHNHVTGFTEEAFERFNGTEIGGPPVRRVSVDVRDLYREFLAGNGEISEFGAGQPVWAHVRSWWNIRHLPNVLLVHYANLKADLPSEVARIARFLDIPLDDSTLAKVAQHCSLDYMRKAAQSNAYLKEQFKNGADTFFNKGTNGRWRDVLSADEIVRCDEIAAKHLTPDCAHWLKTGELRAPTMASGRKA